MRISLRARHAVRAVLDLALHAPAAGGIRSTEIARRTGVPGKFLGSILLDLGKAGFVSSKRGRDGGHWLACDPARTTLGAILEAIDGPLATPPLRTRRRSGAADACLDQLWRDVAAAARGVVYGVTLEDLRRRADASGAADFSI